MKFKRIYIEITNVCNLNCTFCIKKAHQNRFLEPIQFETILKQVKNYTKYIYLHVLGEPLIHPELDTILTLCEKYDMNVQITTNGTLLKEKVNLLKRHKIRQINISVHSFSQQGKATQDTYMKDITEAADQLSKDTYIAYRLWCKQNNQLDPIAQSLYQQLCDHYQIKIQDDPKKITLSKNRFLNFDEVFEWPDIKKAPICTTGTFRGTKDMIALLSNGDVVPCCLDAYGQAKLGNIFQTPLKEIITSTPFKTIHDGFNQNKLTHPLCQGCGYRHLKFDK